MTDALVALAALVLVGSTVVVAAACLRALASIARRIAWLHLTRDTWQRGHRPSPYTVSNPMGHWALSDYHGEAWGPYGTRQEADRKVADLTRRQQGSRRDHA